MDDRPLADWTVEELSDRLGHLSLFIHQLHARVCCVLQRKYGSVLSSKDVTSGLSDEVLGQFVVIRPVFDRLEKVRGILVSMFFKLGSDFNCCYDSNWLDPNFPDDPVLSGCSSELLDVICGVPQGSILGPINDICNVSNLVKLILFADDTNVFCAGDNQLELECMLNRELAKLCKWFAVNKLSLNLTKTSYMLFRNRPPDVDFKVFIEHERINRVHVTKFLGIYTVY